MEAVMDYGKRTLTLTKCSAEEVRLVLQVVNESEIIVLLHEIKANQEKSLMNEEAMAQALADLETASTEQGVSLGLISTSGENLAKDIEAFINKPVPAGGPSDADVTRAKNLVVRARNIADSLKLQADFSTALAAKTEDGAAIVIPPVPQPIPEPAPNPAG